MTINLKELFVVSDQMNDKVLMKLLTAIKDGQQKDFDYLKFKQSYKSLCAMGMDEATVKECLPDCFHYGSDKRKASIDCAALQKHPE
ncbi:MAG: hypothetical protein IPO37_17900 [Saprospiraceae bacterium]|nr:hypothetical protein [Saprospiraceae bacterium]